jgi:hypothetical protein
MEEDVEGSWYANGNRGFVGGKAVREEGDEASNDGIGCSTAAETAAATAKAVMLAAMTVNAKVVVIACVTGVAQAKEERGL